MKSKQTFIDYRANIILQNKVVFTSTDKHILSKIGQFAITTQHFNCINKQNSVLQTLLDHLNKSYYTLLTLSLTLLTEAELFVLCFWI